MMKVKERVEHIAKMIDALYKKLIILLAIAGGFGAYMMKLLLAANWLGYVFMFIFAFVSIAIFGTYLKLNNFIKTLERMTDG